MSDQIPFIDVEFVDNAEPRCPCVLVLDTSSSMRGNAIDELNRGIELFSQELNSDSLASKRVEVAIVSFGQSVQTVQDFVSPSGFVPPRFEANGNTPMGEAVIQACELLESRKTRYKAGGISYFRPWLIVITDGEPTDYQTHFWSKAVDLARDGERAQKLLFFGIAVNDADQSKLNELCPPQRPALKLRGLSFKELFTWLSSTLRVVSSANPGAKALALPSPSGLKPVLRRVKGAVLVANLTRPG
jgi:uncharacterized protein YegL